MLIDSLTAVFQNWEKATLFLLAEMCLALALLLGRCLLAKGAPAVRGRYHRGKWAGPSTLSMQHTTPCIIGRSGFKPGVFPTIWDMRDPDADGYYHPVDFNAPLESHLDLLGIPLSARRPNPQ